jgi:ribonuclease HI
MKITSGQKMNHNKTALFFSKNTTEEDKAQILGIAGLPDNQRYDTYLGLPALVGKSRMAAFRSIIERVWKRLQDWKLKFLSQAGKEILLKAVIQAIPTFCISVFLLPKSLCSEINALMQRFWWGHMERDKKISWMSWSRMGLSKGKGGLGFRDFTSFNKALLAKQCWRLWRMPESLVAKIMKAKYFPDCSILDARQGNKPSFIWRSIHNACHLVREGLIWRVGNGDTIRIWQDKWIPQKSTCMIQSPPVILEPTATVKELMMEGAHEWNQILVNQIFSPDVAKIIFAIPLGGNAHEDTQIWRGTAKGTFSVRSAYHLQKEMEEATQAECSSSKQSSEVWGRIWKLSVSNVEKNFLWKACHDILPTRVNLHRRKVVEDKRCPVCGNVDETTIHALWECPSAMGVWNEGAQTFQKFSFNGGAFLKLVEELFIRCNGDEMIQFAGIVRRIWLRRNKLIFEGVFSSPSEVVKASLAAVEEFQAVQGRKHSGGTMENQIPWRAPPIGWVMVNWDAATDRRRGRCGLGMVIRDHMGNLIAAKCTTKMGNLDPGAAEAIAALEATRFCQSLRLDQIRVVGDAKVVVEAVLSGERDWSTKGHIVDAIRNGLQTFSNWNMCYVRREENKIAHVLAKLATKQSMEQVWFEEPPTCIKELLAREQFVVH